MSRLIWTVLLLLAPAAGAFAAGAAAITGETVLMNQIDFEVRAEREVRNDLAQALLVAEDEDADPARLAAAINEVMGDALTEVRAESSVSVRSGDYRTWPVYSQRRITHWRATQELTLESAQVDRLNSLVGKLQDRLQVRGMHFTVSTERRREVEDELTAEALDRFRTRADAITERLGARGYDIVRLQVVDDGARPPPILMARTMGLPEDSPVASEPGESRVGVAVLAAIQLRF